MRFFALLLMFCCTVLFNRQVIAETITVATGEWPPFIGEQLPDQGSHSQIVRKAFTEMGYEVELSFMNWKRAYELAKRGEFVATYTWSHTEDRSKEMTYPKNPLSVSKEVAFYQTSKFPDGLQLSSMEDIKKMGLKVVGIASYWYEKPLKDLGVETQIVPDSTAAWKILEKGRADILIENSEVGVAEMEKVLGAGNGEKFGMSPALKSQEMYILFSPNHPQGNELAAKFDEAVQKLKAAGEM